MIKRGIPFVKIVAKDNYDFGYKLGKKLREKIQDRIKKNKKLYLKKSDGKEDFPVLVQKAKKFIPAVEKNFPNLLNEAKAMAKGAQVPFEELFVLMCDNEIVDFEIYPPHCTSVSVKTTDNQILIGHNEDWFPEYKENGLVLIRGKIKKNKFLALSYIGNLAGTVTGLNSKKISYIDDSLFFKRISYGTPRSFHMRALLDVRNAKEAIKVLDKCGSAISSTLIVESNKKIVNVEELWTKTSILNETNWFAHTNHTLIKKNQNKDNTKFESIFRYNRACEILKNQKDLDINTVKKVLKDHKGKICSHMSKPHKIWGITKTITSIIMNPSQQWMMICEGNPCKGHYKKYKL